MNKSLIKKLDDLWNLIIKTKAGFRSELSGREGKVIGGNTVLCAHHICGKPNIRLRYEIDNGICMDNDKEHIFGVHDLDPEIAREYQDKIIDYIGKERYERLKTLKHRQKKADLKLIEIYLEAEMKKVLKDLPTGRQDWIE